jgi:hypothetical protein
LLDLDVCWAKSRMASEQRKGEAVRRADLLKEDVTKDGTGYRNDGCYATGKKIRIGAEKVVTE